MPSDTVGLKENMRRWVLLLGVFQITVGCTVGFIPPTAVEWFRGIVMAHIEFAMNGIMMIVFGLLLREMALNRPALWVWFASLQIGTWTNGGAGVIAAFLGSSSKLMPTITEKFPPPQSDNHPLVTNTLIVCGITIMIALLLTLYGLWRGKNLRPTEA
jgi:hypothetical protein